MQSLRSVTKSASAGDGANDAYKDECARAVLNVVPPVVRLMRKMMREHRRPRLSVPQFRAMALLNFNREASLSCVADYVGSSLPAASRMIDGLVAKKLVERKQCCRDRRQVSLELTDLGREAFQDSRRATQLQFAERLAGLTVDQKKGVIKAMEWLGEVFGNDANALSQTVSVALEENS
jgi:DNA-binding MarR family transcriptional regulator